MSSVQTKILVFIISIFSLYNNDFKLSWNCRDFSYSKWGAKILFINVKAGASVLILLIPFFSCSICWPEQWINMFLFILLMFPKSLIAISLKIFFVSLGQRVFLFLDGTNVHQLILGKTCVYAEDSDINPPWEILTGVNVWQLAPVHCTAPGCEALNPSFH